MKKDTFDTFKAVEQRYHELKEEISTDAIMVAKNVAKIRGEHINGSSYNVEFDEENVKITVFNNDYYDDYDIITYPLEYLWNKDYLAIEQKRQELLRMEMELQRKEREKLRDIAEYERYLALKRKYEPDGQETE